MLEEFKKFALKGNVVDLAVGVIIGAAFSSIVSSLVADVVMPVMDGLEAIKLIRRHEEDHDLPTVPIMALSADSQERTRHEVLAHGASGFLTKPIDPAALLHAVEEHAA